VKGKEDDKNRWQLNVRIQGRQPGTQKGVIVGDKKKIKIRRQRGELGDIVTILETKEH
jgi:hypothetical protein